MAHPEEERRALGRRLASARTLAGFTIDSAAKALTERGHPIGKAGVGAWEVGRNVPDALWMKRLAKLYGTTIDALAWDESLSPEAMKIAVEYDHLPPGKQADWRLLWLGYMSGTAPGGESLPAAPSDLTVDQ